MHKWVYEKAECLKNELCGIGMDNLTHEQLEEAYYFSKILKNLVCIDKEHQIVEAMEKSEENDEIMEKLEMYTDYPEKRFYNSRRYVPRHYTHMTPDMYRDWNDMDEKERMRDIDRESMGRMYYTSGTRNDPRMGKSGKGRMRYFESKEMHKANTPNDKAAKMKDLEAYAKELTEDVVEMVADATPEEKMLLRQKMETLISKI